MCIGKKTKCIITSDSRVSCQKCYCHQSQSTQYYLKRWRSLITTRKNRAQRKTCCRDKGGAAKSRWYLCFFKQRSRRYSQTCIWKEMHCTALFDITVNFTLLQCPLVYCTVMLWYLTISSVCEFPLSSVSGEVIAAATCISEMQKGQIGLETMFGGGGGGGYHLANLPFIQV